MDQWSCSHGVEDCSNAEGNSQRRKKVWTFVANTEAMTYPVTFDGVIFDNEADFVEYYGETEQFSDWPYAWADRAKTVFFFCEGCHRDKMAALIPVIMEEEHDLPESYWLDLVA